MILVHDKRKEYEQSRLKMFDALPDIILKKENHAVTLNDFVRISGVSKNTFYNHYHGLFEFYEDYCSWVEENENHVIDSLVQTKSLETIVQHGIQRVKTDKYFRCYIMLKKNLSQRILEAFQNGTKIRIINGN